LESRFSRATKREIYVTFQGYSYDLFGQCDALSQEAKESDPGAVGRYGETFQEDPRRDRNGEGCGRRIRKVERLLEVLGLELTVRPRSAPPTLEELQRGRTKRDEFSVAQWCVTHLRCHTSGVRLAMLQSTSGVSIQLFIFSFLTCFLPAEVSAMSLFSDRVFFPEVRGVVTDRGKPIEGAEIERSFHAAMQDEKGLDLTRTDVSGHFLFKKITKSSSLLSMLPHEPVIGQNIIIKVGGKEYMAWQYVKHDYDDNGELNGKPIDIICDIASDPAKQGGIYGICRLK
jgi:hypothetical protein